MSDPLDAVREDEAVDALVSVVARAATNLRQDKVIIYANDPNFHLPSYEQGYRDGEDNVLADERDE